MALKVWLWLPTGGFLQCLPPPMHGCVQSINCSFAIHISICPMQIFFRSGVSKEIKCLASQVQSLGCWKGTVKYRHLYGLAILCPCFSRSIVDTKIQKKQHGLVLQGELSVWRLLLAVHRLCLGQPLGSPNVTGSRHCSISIRNW